MYTNLGNYLRKLRLKNREILYNMAKKLNLTTPELSAIENGRVEVSEKFLARVKIAYGLSPLEYGKMYDCFISDLMENSKETLNKLDKVMTLDEAILHAEQKAKELSVCNNACSKNHKQLAE